MQLGVFVQDHAMPSAFCKTSRRSENAPFSVASLIVVTNQAKVQRAVLFTRRNELVQDRVAGAVWASHVALAVRIRRFT